MTKIIESETQQEKSQISNSFQKQDTTNPAGFFNDTEKKRKKGNTVSFHYTLARMAKNKKTDNIEC